MYLFSGAIMTFLYNKILGILLIIQFVFKALSSKGSICMFMFIV